MKNLRYIDYKMQHRSQNQFRCKNEQFDNSDVKKKKGNR